MSGVGAPKRACSSMTKTLVDIIKALALAAFFFFIVQAVLQNYQVLGQSMEPNLHSGQHVIVNKAAYMSVDLDSLSKFIPFYEVDGESELQLFGEPQRGRRGGRQISPRIREETCKANSGATGGLAGDRGRRIEHKRPGDRRAVCAGEDAGAGKE